VIRWQANWFLLASIDAAAPAIASRSTPAEVGQAAYSAQQM
jgi:hypothetical protein